ncbi:MAG: spore cortex biosynthesis protein YabQ [Anaerocolumna sp.]
MNGAILVELRFFGASVLWGVLLLVIYDCLRIERRLISHNSFFVAVEDIIYWMVASILIFRMMFNLNDGIIRGFSILAMLIGMLIYHHVFSGFIVDVVSGILIKIKTILFKLIGYILAPFRKFMKWLKKLMVFFTKAVKKLTKNLQKRLKKKTKPSKITVNDNELKKLDEAKCDKV